MRESGGNDTQGWVIDTQVWVDAWRRMYPSKSALMVARDLDAPARTVEKWFSGEAKPSFDYWGKILNRYGLGFVVAGMATPLPHLDDLAREERRARLIAERQSIDALLAEDWQRRSPR
ncbi:MAG: hypothetical protein WAP03_21855 [Methylorubrum rhodinum]